MKKTLLMAIIAFFGLFTTAYSQQCGGTFTDPAGPTTNYANSSDYTVTICPSNPGDVVTVSFTSFDIEVNWDALYVFNGPTIDSPQISSTNPAANVPGGLAGGYWGTVNPGPFTSTDPSGCLTFRFRSDVSVSRAGWIANIDCAPPGLCVRPNLLNTSNVTSTTFTLGWTENGSATGWEYLILPLATPAPSNNTAGTPVTTNPLVITSLSPGTCYAAYVRSICTPTGFSNWSASASVCTLPAPPACGGQFVDNGGVNGNFANNSDDTYIICSQNSGEVVTVTFTSFNMEATFDALYVFNGNSIAAPQIASNNLAGNVPGGLAGGYWGSTIPGPFTSTSSDGCLTFRFRSDASVSLPGWVANVTCGPPPACSLPTSLTTNTLTHNSVTLNWIQPQNPDTSVANAWQVLALPCGAPAPLENATGYIDVTTPSPYTLAGLNPSTCYSIYIRAVCSSTSVCPWVPYNPITTLAAPPVCGGQFIDNGGTQAYYLNNSDVTTTICPTNPGEVVTVAFTSFNTEVNWDALYVFDGNSISAPQISSGNPAANVPGGIPGGFWGTTTPGPFTSSSTDGCLTFRFRSDGSVNNPGWVADVTCAAPPDRLMLVAYVDQNTNGVRDTGEPLFTYGNFVYQQNNNGVDVNGYSPTGQFALYDSNPSNSYSIIYQMQSEFNPYYNPGTTIYTNASIPIGSGTQFLYFPITLIQEYNDVSVSIIPTNLPRPGFTYTNLVIYRNNGVTATDGTITFTKPSQITTFTVSPNATNNVSGFTYNFTNLLPGESRTLTVTMTVPDAVTANTVLTDDATVSAPSGDISTANNSSSNSQIVVNSLDPNDKMESRGKTIPFNTFAQDDYFFYTIRFQNEGTANAIDVRIEDVLNSQIDETTVEMVSSDHNYIMKRIGNQLVWDFKNIYLPPMSGNENGSKGYVQFKVKLNPGFQAGDIIPNNASIYFDNNPAVVTNTFNSKFTMPLGIADFNANSFALHPNPANNMVHIDLIDTTAQLQKVVFYDVLGKAVKVIPSIVANSITVDVSDLSKGIYLVEISSDNNLKLTKKLIVQ